MIKHIPNIRVISLYVSKIKEEVEVTRNSVYGAKERRRNKEESKEPKVRENSLFTLGGHHKDLVLICDFDSCPHECLFRSKTTIKMHLFGH